MVATLKISQVNISGGTQPRARIDLDLVAEYADRILAGDSFPPVEVVFDGKDYWLWDGFHRYHGHVKAGKKEIAVNIREGTARDAVLLSCGANGHHGLRRTPEDKRNAVERLFEDPEWAAKSDRWIAEQCGVSHTFVATVRGEIQLATVANCQDDSPPDGAATEERHYDDSESQDVPDAEPPKRTGKDGKKYKAKKPATKRTTKKPAEPEGGYEKHEALKPLGKMDALLTKMMAELSAAERILGKPALAPVHAGLDAAYKGLQSARKQLRRA